MLEERDPDLNDEEDIRMEGSREEHREIFLRILNIIVRSIL